MLYLISLIILFLIVKNNLLSPVVLHKKIHMLKESNIFNKKYKYYYIGILLFGIFVLYAFTSDSVYENKYVQAMDTEHEDVKGINVSNNDGNIDLSSPSEAGCSYVYIKATEGATYEDSYMDDYYKKCKNLGMKVGAYHYLVNTSTPEEQADNFYKMISKYKWD
ncbi:MAG: GH25 family lysozyme, partial [Clostridium sp.]